MAVEPRELKARFSSREQFELLQDYTGDETQLIVIFPALMNFEMHPMKKVHDWLRKTIDGLNYEIVDLYHPFSAHRAEDLIQKPRDFTHPNKFGTRIAAEATFDALVFRDLVPQ